MQHLFFVSAVTIGVLAGYGIGLKDPVCAMRKSLRRMAPAFLIGCVAIGFIGEMLWEAIQGK
jgi:hypothetical protein